MGLSAGQARLLTITARKSDCEYQSMRLSHQKISLSRQLADLSNEYQNSLDQTKLIYDYYGTGDESTPLSYGLCMTPSALNEYMPILFTDQLGRVTLNSDYAAAARAAGIPQEGLGTLPSQKMRNAFIQSLAGEGLITDQLATTLQVVEYNQGAGFGDNVSVKNNTVSGNINDLQKYLYENCTDVMNEYPAFVNGGNVRITSNNDTVIESRYGCDSSGNVVLEEGSELELNIYSLFGNSIDPNYKYSEYNITIMSEDGQTDIQTEADYMKTYMTDKFIPWLRRVFGKVLGDGLDEGVTSAFDYADEEIIRSIIDTTCVSNPNNAGNFFEDHRGTAWRTSDFISKAQNANQNYIGMVGVSQHGRKVATKGRNTIASINLNNIVSAYLTYFVDKMNGIDAVGSDGRDQYYVNTGLLSSSRLVDDQYEFTIYTGTEIVDSDLQLAAFYDTIFNQICASGWTENNEITDTAYLQKMLQSGMLFISKSKDDGYYYQGNYATDSYIKEITDESAIAEAEAKYNTEKAKLNSKEETLDLKMKNLDTEISSLTTEYDTVKNTISKNIEKSFKRYNA